MIQIPDKPTIEWMANALGDRKGVWWACQSCDMVSGKLTPADNAAVNVARTWVKSPDPDMQEAAAAAATKAGFNGPGAWAAQAVAWAKPIAAMAKPAMAVAGAAHGGGAGAVVGAVSSAAGAAPGMAGAAPGLAGLGAVAGVAGMAAGIATGGGATAAATMAAGLMASAGAQLVPHAVAGAVKLAATLSTGQKLPALPLVAAVVVGQPVAPQLALPKIVMPLVPPTVPLSPAQLEELDKTYKPFIDLGKAILEGKNTWV